MNGSSDTGHCSNVTVSNRNTLSRSRCDSPSTSVLFDGIIPTLTALDGNMWATQLLTLRSSSGILSFPFSLNVVRRVEVVMFNCPQWGISLQRVHIGSNSFSILHNITSCDSLVRVCATVPRNSTSMSLFFFPYTGSNWTHLAELTFYNDNLKIPSFNQKLPQQMDKTQQAAVKTLNIPPVDRTQQAAVNLRILPSFHQKSQTQPPFLLPFAPAPHPLL